MEQTDIPWRRGGDWVKEGEVISKEHVCVHDPETQTMIWDCLVGVGVLGKGRKSGGHCNSTNNKRQ